MMWWERISHPRLEGFGGSSGREHAVTRCGAVERGHRIPRTLALIIILTRYALRSTLAGILQLTAPPFVAQESVYSAERHLEACKNLTGCDWLPSAGTLPWRALS